MIQCQKNDTCGEPLEVCKDVGDWARVGDMKSLNQTLKSK